MMLEIHNFTQNEIDEEFLKRVAKSALKTAGIKDRAEISLAIVGDGQFGQASDVIQMGMSDKNKIN